MIPRILSLPLDESFFLFGPRGVGKTTILRHLIFFENALYINLLRAKEERQFTRDPDSLEAIVAALPETTTHIIIDEIQKIPKLLDVVHHLIESTDKKFILTGSNARKLKHGGANLLAGRAFVYDLHPFTYLEIRDHIELNHFLSWGMLPKIFEYDTDEKKQRFLEAYANTYLKEEIWVEQFIRDLEPFRHFLEVAAQANGKIINFSNIARDVGVGVHLVQKYFSILEDTLLGFFLNSFQHSFRKRLSKTPKFYFFDTGVARTLSGHISLPLRDGNSSYGELFEHFVIVQCKNLSSYYHRDYKFSYLSTKDGAEIDLVVERPGKAILFIEVKSSNDVKSQHLTTLKQLAKDFGDCEAVCFSRDNFAKRLDGVTIFPWQEGIKRYFEN
ncbi:MAG: ATP-binding protein [Gammaproteobacteria bacterium]